MKETVHIVLLVFAAAALSGSRAGAQAAGEPPETPASEAPQTTQEQLDALDQQIRIMQRKKELEQEAAAEKAKTTPVVTVGKDGFSLKSADGAHVLKLRGYVQMDGRFIVDGRRPAAANTFLLRRARPIFEGTVFKSFDFRLMIDFGEGRTTLQDGHLDARFAPQIALRAGKFKTPFGLERLQSATELTFVERGLPTGLAPNRDHGVQIYGDLGGGTIRYAAGVFNGVADGGSGDIDADNNKEAVARVVVSPFVKGSSAARGLGLALATSWGKNVGTTSAHGLAGYRTPGQQSFFAYRAAAGADSTTIADGRRFRLSPQVTYFGGPLGVMGEFVAASQELRVKRVGEHLTHEAWHVSASYVLTGESATYKAVTPKRPFDRAAGAWGAFEVAGRFGRFRADDAAFPIFADPRASARRANSWGGGINWYVNKSVKIALSFDQTEFDGGGGAADRATEKAFAQRFQLAF